MGITGIVDDDIDGVSFILMTKADIVQSVLFFVLAASLKSYMEKPEFFLNRLV